MAAPLVPFLGQARDQRPACLGLSGPGIETLIAAALLLGVARKFTYAAGAVFSLLIWAIAEGFGGPYSSSSTDVGAGIVYALVFAFLLVVDVYGSATAPHTIDDRIEGRIGWWWHLADRRPA